MSFLLHWLSSALLFLWQAIDFLPRHLWVLLLQGLAKVVNDIPVPSWLSAAPADFSSLPPWVVYFASALQIGPGLSIVVSAYVARFILRRIPLVGN